MDNLPNYYTKVEVPSSAAPIPGFPGYAITPEGDVWKTSPTQRGRNAGLSAFRVIPSTHFRSKQWYVNIVGEDGRRVRVALWKLKARAFGIDSVAQ